MAHGIEPTIEHVQPIAIDVMSRHEAERRYGVGTDADDVATTAIVSICTPSGIYMSRPEFDGRLLDVLHEEFDDVEEGDSCGDPMTEAQAEEVVSFIRRTVYAGCTHLVVHCDAGVSRSAGTAAALGLAMGNGDDFVFSSPRFCPNMTCYRRVLEAAGLSVGEDSLDERTRESYLRWWEEWQRQDEDGYEGDEW